MVKSLCVFKSREQKCLHDHLESAVLVNWRGAGTGACAASVDVCAVCACVGADKGIYSLSALVRVVGSACIVWWLFSFLEFIFSFATGWICQGEQQQTRPGRTNHQILSPPYSVSVNKVLPHLPLLCRSINTIGPMSV